MHAFRSRRWSTLAVLFVFTAPAVRAGMITPDSIPNPPSAVGSANGTPVYTSNLVTTEYKGLGLNFSHAAAILNGVAITNLNGTSVWAPTEGLARPGNSIAGSTPVGNPVAQINYSSKLSGSIVSPGSLNPTTVSSLAVQIVGDAAVSMNVYGFNGQRLNITPLIGSIAGVQDWTFTGTGISSFSAVVAPPIGAHPGAITNTAWGVAGVSFTPASAPEPSSLLLAGLGALGLVTRLGWRRSRRLA
jgi:hypothetical protein